MQTAQLTHLAEAAVTCWESIDENLSPVLGRRGVAAMYARSVHLTTATNAWLHDAQSGEPLHMNLALLKSVITRQTHGEATAGTEALLRTFHQLLASLVSPLLAERLLRLVEADLCHPMIRNSAPPPDS